MPIFNKSLSSEPSTIKLPFNLEKIDTLLVDIDGTLLNTTPHLYRLYTFFLQQFHQEGSEGEFEELVGCTLAEVFLTLSYRYQIKSLSENLQKQCQALYFSGYDDPLPFFPGAIETLRAWQARKGKVVLVSSAPGKILERVRQYLDKEAIYTTGFSGDTLGYGKNNPKIFQHALQQVNVTSSSALVIEDTLYGVKSAQQSQIYGIHYNVKGGASALFHEGWVEVSHWSLIAECLAL